MLDSYPDDAQASTPSDAEMLAGLLAGLGYATPAGAHLTVPGALRLLEQEGHPLAQYGQLRLQARLDLMRHHAHLVRTHTPGYFAGELLLFTAADPAGPDLAGPDLAGHDRGGPDVAQRQRSWWPHVSGAVDCHLVECNHEQMMGAPPAAEIARVLGGALSVPGGVR